MVCIMIVLELLQRELAAYSTQGVFHGGGFLRWLCTIIVAMGAGNFSSEQNFVCCYFWAIDEPMSMTPVPMRLSWVTATNWPKCWIG